MSAYQEFLETKRREVLSLGPTIDPGDLHPDLFPFQRELVAWAIRKGRAALFADTGLGKSFMQIEWARQIGKRTLILAPLAVTAQTVREGESRGITVTYAREMSESPESGITITNYERLEKFDVSVFDSVVLDESSVLKNYTGKTKRALIEAFRQTPYRLCCTATPAPNDTVELCNHADFLGVMSPAEMLSTFFTPKGSYGDGRSLQAEHAYRLKGHARSEFWRWLSTWSMAVKRPSDIGFDDAGYDLPPLTIDPIFVASHWTPKDQLLFTRLRGVSDRSAIRKETIEERVARAAELIAQQPDEQWLIWCGLNDEARLLQKAIAGSVNVEGSQSPDEKASALLAFADGEIQHLVTKPGIAGFGMNFQRCARMVFVGLSDSYEQYYQAIRRCWRFGQTRPVEAWIVLTDVESDIYNNVKRKESQAIEMQRELIEHMRLFEREELRGAHRKIEQYEPKQAIRIPAWLYENVEAA